MPTTQEALNRAVSFHQAGQLSEAEALYRQVLQADPSNAYAWHLLGVIASQVGQHQAAAECIGRAVEIDPNNAEAHSNLGNALRALGKPDDAATHYRQALSLQPKFADAHYNFANLLFEQGKNELAIDHYRRALKLGLDIAQVRYNLGIALQRVGKWRDAEINYKRAIECNPQLVEAHISLGIGLGDQGRLDEAIECYRRAIDIKPDYADALSSLGNALIATGRLQEALQWDVKPEVLYSLGAVYQSMGCLDEALACYRRVLELQPNFAAAHSNLGSALLAQGKSSDAEAAFRRALEIRPDYASAHSNLGAALLNQGNRGEAIVCFRKAVELDPSHAGAHYNLGTDHLGQGKLEDAIVCLRRAAELQPEHVEALSNLGTAYQEIGFFDEAAASFRRVVELSPSHAAARANLSILALLSGDFEGGWHDYEWRWQTGKLPTKDFGRPRWKGEPVEDKTVLIWAEQGLGDTIQFVRYAALVKERGARVIFECQKPLLNLLIAAESSDRRRSSGIDQFVVEGDLLPEFDCQIPILSLPNVFKTTLTTIPAEVPYLFADDLLAARWRESLKKIGGFRIGINWQGRMGPGLHQQRDIPVEMFERLTEFPGVCLISLQKKDAERRLGDAHPRIVDLGELDTKHGTFMDTAAIMMNLDLVITSDTSVAHLAGALGVPVWVALPMVPDWRWLLDRSDSPWYPTMRLFRQSRSGDWNCVFEEIEVALREAVQHRRC